MLEVFLESGYTLLSKEDFPGKMNKRNGLHFIKKNVKEERFVMDVTDCPILFSELEHDKLYIIVQPFGSQSPPDVLLVRLVKSTKEEKDTLYVFPLEVKQGKGVPTWNNNPPKSGFGYVFFDSKDQQVYYASGKEIRGYTIITDNVFKEVHATICKEAENCLYDKDSNTRIVSYKKIECLRFPKNI